jgi:uncharacterized membrane protein
MQMKTKSKLMTEKLVLGAIMTTLVIVFQLLATFTTFFGPFSTAIALIPIVIGAALCGVVMGGWLGFVFGVVVLASGGGAFFMAFDILGTVITVLAKGTACGLAAGLVYHLLEKLNKYVAVFAAAVVCPAVNTGVFLLGCRLFFYDSVADIASALGSDASGMAVFFALATANFIFELGMNIVLSPVTLRILNIKQKSA